MFFYRHTFHSVNMATCLSTEQESPPSSTLGFSVYSSILGEQKSEFECSLLTRHSEEIFLCVERFVQPPEQRESWAMNISVVWYQVLLAHVHSSRWFLRGALVRKQLWGRAQRPAWVRHCSAVAGGSSARAPSGPPVCTALPASVSRNLHSKRYNLGSSGSAQTG